MTAEESDQVVDPAELPAWRLLAELASGQALPSIAELLDGDADRFAAFSLRLNELLVDFSRSSADAVVVEGLLQLASERNLAGSSRLCSPVLVSTRPSGVPPCIPLCVVLLPDAGVGE